MRAYWILPNRDQGDVVLASDGETTVPLRQILDPELRPDGFSHGIPTEVLETCGPAGLDEVLFAQCFPAGSDGTRLASVFTPAGVDSSGRVVHLGLLYFLGPGERPDFALPYARLPPDDRAHASALISRMTDRGRGDPWAASVHELFGLPRLPGPATNVELTRSVTPFHALYALGRGGLTKIAEHRPASLSAKIMVSTVLVVVGVSVSVSARHCAELPRGGAAPSHTATCTGGVTWRFS